MSSYLTPAQARRRRFFFRLKLYFLFLILSLAAVGLFYFLNESKLWRIEKFEVVGNKRLSAEQIISGLKPVILTNFAGKFLGFNHFLSWYGQENIYLSSPSFVNLNISADLSGKEVKIFAEEKEPYGIWCQGFVCWWFDKEGMVFEIAPYSEGPLIFRVSDSSNKPFILGDKVLDEKEFKYFKAILESTKDLGFSIESITFDKALQELTVILGDGSRILFSLRFDPSFNIGALKTLKEKGALSGLDYADLRVENRVYIKNRS